MAKTTRPPVKSTSFKLDVLALASGTVAGQMLTILTAPILGRLFDAEAFGIFALVASIAAVFASVDSLKFEQAIMLPEKDEDAANLGVGAFGISLAFNLLLLPALWVFGPLLAGWLNAPEIIRFLLLVPLIVLFGGFGPGHSILAAWAARMRRFSQISSSRLAGAISTNLAKLAAGFAGFNSGAGLISGSVIGSIVSPLLLGWRIWREDGKFIARSIRFHRIRSNLARYRKFAIYNTPSALLNTLSIQIPQFLLAIFFSTAVVGFYSFGYQLLSIPMSLIGTSVSQAFYPHAAAAHKQRELGKFVESAFRRLIEYSLFPTLMLMISGRELFSVVFGSRWAEAGVYAQILSLWLLFWFISMPLSQLFNVLEKNEFYFRWNLVILLTRVASIWLGAALGSPRLALVFFSASGACIYAYISYWVSLKAGVHWTLIAGMLMRNFIIFVPAGGLILVSQVFPLPDLVVALLASVLTGLYFLYRLRSEAAFHSIFSRIGRFFTK